MTDTQLIDWLETQFSGKWRMSIFIAHELGSEMVLLERKSDAMQGVIHRAKTVRGAIKLAMEFDRGEDEPAESEYGPSDHQQELSRAGHEASEARYRQNMTDAGRSHLLP